MTILEKAYMLYVEEDKAMFQRWNKLNKKIVGKPDPYTFEEFVGIYSNDDHWFSNVVKELVDRVQDIKI